MQLAIAPIAYYWDKATVLQCYSDLADSAVEIVYLGEVVCSRRHQLRLDDWLELATELRQAGKQVVLSSMTLIDTEADRRAMHKLVDRAAAAELLVEANDYSAVRALQGQSFIAGPHLNAYHTDTLAWLASLGACRFIAPLEMSAQDLQQLVQAVPELACEVQGWGRLALAYSARCFTARHHRLRKDACEFRCLAYPEGLAVQTQESQPFLNLNGIQTQSASCIDLGPQIPKLVELGVQVLRLQPQSTHLPELIRHFSQALATRQAAQIPEHCLPAQALRSNGYWLGRAGMEWAKT